MGENGAKSLASVNVRHNFRFFGKIVKIDKIEKFQLTLCHFHTKM